MTPANLIELLKNPDVVDQAAKLLREPEVARALGDLAHDPAVSRILVDLMQDPAVSAQIEQQLRNVMLWAAIPIGLTLLTLVAVLANTVLLARLLRRNKT